jgi:hypothetical protein
MISQARLSTEADELSLLAGEATGLGMREAHGVSGDGVVTCDADLHFGHVEGVLVAAESVVVVYLDSESRVTVPTDLEMNSFLGVIVARDRLLRERFNNVNGSKYLANRELRKRKHCRL